MLDVRFLLQWYLVVGVVNLQTFTSNDCERISGGRTMYLPCAASPLHLMRTSTFATIVTPNSATCGNPRTAFCTLGIPTCGWCDATNPKEQHPTAAMIDGSRDTWWQSRNWLDYPTPLHVNVTFSFNKSYELQSDLVLTFRHSRPQSMVLEHSNDFGVTWQPLQFYQRDCRSLWASGIARTVPASQPATVICSQDYSLETPYTGGSVVFPVMSERFRLFLGEQSNDYNSLYTALQREDFRSFLTFTDLRIRLLYPATDGKESLRRPDVLRRYFYSISDVEVVAGCFCNLHARFCDVTPTGRTRCLCRHNTGGQSCQHCLPLYNQRPWKPGSYLPLPSGTANECVKCNCNDHAISCTFNALANAGLCNNCTHNTAGNNCERCKVGFFRDAGQPITSRTACLECKCALRGVINNETSCSSTGQCRCMPNVRGLRCDTCADMFYGLNGNQTTCLPCSCNRDGTAGGSNQCDKTTGQCPCKDHVDGRACDRCRDGFYGYPRGRANADCTVCGCNTGGTVTSLCDRVTGQCACHSNITGRTCDTPTTGFFVPKLDFLTQQPTSGTCAIGTALISAKNPFSGPDFRQCTSGQTTRFHTIDPSKVRLTKLKTDMQLVLRYTLEGNTSWTGARLTVTTGGSSNVNMAAYNVNRTTPLSSTCPIIPAQQFVVAELAPQIGAAASANDILKLDARCRYNVELAVGNGKLGRVLVVDSLVVRPNLPGGQLWSQTQDKAALINCVEMQTTLRDEVHQSSVRCLSWVKSLAAETFGGAIPCKCSSSGSRSTTSCGTLGGQCACQSGVTGRICDRCAPGFYNLTSTGCTPCRCVAYGSKSLVCDIRTGQCPCRDNVATQGSTTTAGMKADTRCPMCRALHFGLVTGKGCKPCVCNSAGSRNLQCLDSGKCLCKPTIGGDKCDRCIDGFYKFGQAGCVKCSCNQTGSMTLACDKTSGNCLCKRNVGLRNCTKCRRMSYNLAADNPDGCQSCFCYGQGTSCTSQAGWTSSKIVDNAASTWPIRMFRGTLYYAATDVFLGDQRRSYSQALTLTLTLPRNRTYVDFANTISLISGTTSLTYNGSQVPDAGGTWRLTLHEYSWRINETQSTTSMELTRILSALSAIYVRRVFGNNSIVVLLRSASLETIKPVVIPNSSPSDAAENCTCKVGANVEGPSCERCKPGFRRTSINGTHFEPCVACDCSSRRPPNGSVLCDESNGRCLNCAPGTTGFHCENCTSNVGGPRCNVCDDGFWGLGEHGCQPCACHASGASSPVCDKTSGQCKCRDNVVSRDCSICADNFQNLTMSGCTPCDSCYKRVLNAINALRVVQDNVTAYVTELKGADNSTSTMTMQTRQNEAMTKMNKLTSFFKSASSLDGKVNATVRRVSTSVKTMLAALTIDVRSSLFASNSSISRMEVMLNRTSTYFTSTVSTLSDMHSVVIGPIATTSERLRLLSARLAATEADIIKLSHGAVDHVRRVSQIVETLKNGVASSGAQSTQTLEVARNTEQLQRELVATMERLRRDVDVTIGNVGNVSTSSRDALLRARVGVVAMQQTLANTSNFVLPAINEAGLVSRAASLQTVSNTHASQASDVPRQTLSIAKASSAKSRYAVLATRISTLTNVSRSVDSRVQAAYKSSVSAEALAVNTFNSATEMHDVMTNFKNLAANWQTSTISALRTVQAIRVRAEDAIHRSQELQNALRNSQSYSTNSLQLVKDAQTDFLLKREQIQPIATSIVQLEYLRGNLSDTASTLIGMEALNGSVLQPGMRACDAVQANLRANEERLKRAVDLKNNATKFVDETQLRLAKLSASVTGIREISAAEVRSIEEGVNIAHKVLNEAGLADLTAQLRKAKESQKLQISQLLKRRDNLRILVKRLKDIQDELANP